jgi:hypothetical protein
MDDIDSVFKYYAGYSSSGEATLMSRNEFHHFIIHTGVFDQEGVGAENNVHLICDQIFKMSKNAEKHRFMQVTEESAEKQQPDLTINFELAKTEFLECVLRIAHQYIEFQQKNHFLKVSSCETGSETLAF